MGDPVARIVLQPLRPTPAVVLLPSRSCMALCNCRCGPMVSPDGIIRLPTASKGNHCDGVRTWRVFVDFVAHNYMNHFVLAAITVAVLVIAAACVGEAEYQPTGSRPSDVSPTSATTSNEALSTPGRIAPTTDATPAPSKLPTATPTLSGPTIAAASAPTPTLSVPRESLPAATPTPVLQGDERPTGVSPPTPPTTGRTRH